MPMDRQKGDQLPVSVFQKYGVLDGTWENGTLPSPSAAWL